MLRLPPFRFVRPDSPQEAARILAGEGPRAQLVAGGTDLWPKMKRRQMTPATVIGLQHLDQMHSMEGSPQRGISLGANWTLSELERHPLLLEHYPAVAEAARSISSPPLKTMATLGGNLCLDTRCNYYDQTYEWRKSIDFCMKKEGEICWVAPSSPRCWAVTSTDLAPVMLALDARIHLLSSQGERVIAAQDLYADDGIRYLSKRPDEILTRVDLPPVNGDRMAFLKLRRRGSIDFPILNVAVRVRPGQDGRVCQDIRIAIGAVASRPFLAEQAQQALQGQPLDDQRIEEAARLCFKAARPLDNTDLNFSWRHKMVPVYVRRALQEVAALMN
ncbi:MAG: FAD binding domain-containing protein [Acidobacteriota bacterium]